MIKILILIENDMVKFGDECRGVLVSLKCKY